MSIKARWQGTVNRLENGQENGGIARKWVAPFVALVLLLFFGDLAIAPGRSLVSVYSEAVLKRPPYFASTLLSVQVIFGALAAFVGGGLADTLGQKRVMILGASGLPVVGLVFLLHSPLALVILWTYIGFTFGLYTIGRQSYMMAMVPVRFLGTATALIFAGLTLGSALGNSLAAPVVDNYGFGTLGLGVLVLGGIVFVAALVAMPAAQGESQRKGMELSFAGYSSVLRRRGVLLVGIVRFIPTAYWGTATLLFPLLIYRAAHAPSAAAYYGTASLLFASCCQLLTGRLCDRYGRRYLVVILTGLIATLSLLASLVTASLAGLYVVGILGAGAAWSLSTIIPGLVNDVAPRVEHGRTLGLMHVAWSAGMAVGNQIGGWLVDFNSGLPFLVMGLANLITVASAIALSRRIAQSTAAFEVPASERA